MLRVAPLSVFKEHLGLSVEGIFGASGNDGFFGGWPRARVGRLFAADLL